MGLKCKHFNKINKNKNKIQSCQRRPWPVQAGPKEIDFFFQSCPHRPCVYEGNFATLCRNAQGLRWQLSKKKNLFFPLVPPAQASADSGLCRQDLIKKIDFFFESCQRRPCALTHKVAKLLS